MKNLQARVGRRVRHLRKQRGWTMEGLAGKADDLNPKYLGALERGEVNVTVGTLARVGKALGVEPWELLLVRAEEAGTEAPSAADVAGLVRRAPEPIRGLLFEVVRSFASWQTAKNPK